MIFNNVFKKDRAQLRGNRPNSDSEDDDVETPHSNNQDEVKFKNLEKDFEEIIVKEIQE